MQSLAFSCMTWGRLLQLVMKVKVCGSYERNKILCTSRVEYGMLWLGMDRELVTPTWDLYPPWLCGLLRPVVGPFPRDFASAREPSRPALQIVHQLWCVRSKDLIVSGCMAISFSSTRLGLFELLAGKANAALDQRQEFPCKIIRLTCCSILAGQKSVEELWLELFSDPSQWWDHRSHKVNPRFPDFKHRTTGLALWVSGRSNPKWVKTQLAAMMPGWVPRSPFCWNATLLEYAKSERGLEALELFRQLQAEGMTPDSFTFAAVLNACASLGALQKGRCFHAQIVQSGYASDVFVASCLIDMYAKCGSIDDAQRVFKLMPTRDTVSWNTLLGGYVKCEQGQKAFELYQKMKTSGVKPNSVTYATVLNSCSSSAALEEGRQVHADVIETGYESDVRVANCLVDMYAKCDSLVDAQKVFNEIPTRNVGSWTALLVGYVKCSQAWKALELYQSMQAEGIKPNTVTFGIVLKACASAAALEEGRFVHAEIIQSGGGSDLRLGNCLVDMYGKSGSIEDARSVFDAMPTRDVVSWTAMLAGYVKCEQGQDALDLYQNMQGGFVKPNSVTYATILNACASLLNLEQGRRFHTEFIESGCEFDTHVGNCLVDMYAKCGSTEEAWKVFNSMHTRNVVTWTAMILGYVKCEQGQKALELYQQMKEAKVKPNSFTFSAVLNACASSAALEEGIYVHAEIIGSGCDFDVCIGNCLIDMYAKCGSMENAGKVFNTMPTRDVLSWNAMLSGFVKFEQGQKALELYRHMRFEGVMPNALTFGTALSACGSSAYLQEGMNIHSDIIQSDYDGDLVVANSLVSMYAKCGSIEHAERVFKEMPVRDLVSWTAMLSGCMKCEQGHKVLALYQQMQAEGVKPNTATFVAIVTACASVGDLEEGRHIHAEIVRSGLESDMFVGSSLIDMYAKFGCIDDAQQVFIKLSKRDIVSWTSMIVGYVKCGQGQKAMKLYREMQAEGLKPDSVSFAAVLNACAISMALAEGRNVHSEVVESGCLSDVHVGNCLVNMYAKCGSINDARRVFNMMPTRDMVSWTTMLGGLAMHGHGIEAISFFVEMCQAGVEMNKIVFVCLLTACSHSGLVKEGLQYFESMSSVYGITPTVQHFLCIVDLLGRAGRLDEAEGVVLRIVQEPNVTRNDFIIAWKMILAACQNHGNLELGERAAKEVLRLDPSNASGYVTIQHLCSSW